MSHLIPILIICLLSINAMSKQVTLNWEKIDSAVSYEIEILKEGKAHIKKEIEEKLKWKSSFKTGSYKYHIRSLDWRKEAGEWSDWQYFVVTPETPEIKKPVIEGEQISFEWDKIDGATNYELVIRQDDKIVKTEIAPGTVMSFKKPVAGWYSANLKSIRKIKDKNYLPCESSESEAVAFSTEEKVEPRNVASELIETVPLGNSQIEFQAGYIPFSYEVNSTRWLVHGEGKASALSLKLEAIHYLSRRIFLEIKLQNTSYKLEPKTAQQKDIELGTGYHFKLSESGDWKLKPFIGVGLKDYFALGLDSSLGLNGPRLYMRQSAIGPVLECNLESDFSKTLRGSFKAGYFYPLIMVDSNSEMSKRLSLANFKLELVGYYQLQERMELGLGFSWGKNNLNYKTRDSFEEQVTLSSLGVFTTVAAKF